MPSSKTSDSSSLSNENTKYDLSSDEANHFSASSLGSIESSSETPNRQIFQRTMTYPMVLRSSLKRAGLVFSAAIPFGISDYINGITLSYDEDLFAAYSLMRAFYVGTNTVCLAPLTAISVVLGHDLEADEEPPKIIRTMQAGLLFSAFTAVPALIVYSSVGPLLIALNQDETQADLVQSFYWAYLPGAPAFLLRYSGYQVMNGFHLEGWSVLTNMIFTAALTPLLTYTFALGKFGFQQMEEKGYAYALIVENWLGFVSYQLILYFNKRFENYRSYHRQGSFLTDLKKLAKLGMPVTLAILGEVSSLVAIAVMAGAISEEALISQNIAALYMYPMVLLAQSFFISTGVLVSRSVGAGALGNVKPYLIVNLGLAAVVPSIMLFLSIAAPNILIEPFLEATSSSDDPGSSSGSDVVSLTKPVLPLMAISQLLEGGRMVFSGVLFGLEKVEIPTVSNAILQILVGLPLMYILGFETDLGLTGIFLAYTIGLALSDTVMLTYFLREYTKLFDEDDPVIIEEVTDEEMEGSELDALENDSASTSRSISSAQAAREVGLFSSPSVSTSISSSSYSSSSENSSHHDSSSSYSAV